MALSSQRVSQNVSNLFRQRFGIEIDAEGRRLIETLFEGLVQEIRENLEAEGVESPSEGYTVNVPSTGGGTVNVDGISVTGTIPRGRFR